MIASSTEVAQPCAMKTPSYEPFAHVPENRFYVSEDAADAFLLSFLAFSASKIVVDQRAASEDEIGNAGTTFRRIQVDSTFRWSP
jgi:hypothetical protein